MGELLFVVGVVGFRGFFFIYLFVVGGWEYFCVKVLFGFERFNWKRIKWWIFGEDRIVFKVKSFKRNLLYRRKESVR